MASSRMISTGRGGAGNLRQSKEDVDDNEDNSLPELHTKKFTTGRGGAGNMMDNIDPDSTRAAQGEHDPYFESASLAPKPSMSVGRGGYGNMVRTTTYTQDKEDSSKKSLCEKLSSSL